MEIARYYDESKNGEGAFFAGVPLADITPELWEALPAWLQASVDAAPMYRKTPVPKARAQDEPQDGIDATGAAREMAAALGVDLATVTGTGEGGRIIKTDVEAALPEGVAEEGED